MFKRVGVVADDITGANDIGVMFAKNGCATGVFPMSKGLKASEFEELQVVILDTNSRFDSKEAAAKKVKDATQLLLKENFDIYFNKTCSVFRGNVGAEFDAMQDVLKADCSMIIAGFPKNGRITIDGIHYLNGKRLDESVLINDPVHPTKEPQLSKIIGKQSDRGCELFSHRELDLPQLEREKAFIKKKSECSYLIFDVRNQQDLKTIAKLVADERNICGSSAIGEELPAVWGYSGNSSMKQLIHTVTDKCGTLILAGSLTMQTTAQVEYLKSKGYFFVEINTLELFDLKKTEDMLKLVTNSVSEVILSGKPALIYTSNKKEQVAETKQVGYNLGLSDEEIGRLVSNAVSHLVQKICQTTGLKKLVVAGGDTSAAVSDAFSLTKMLILNEIEPGVPTMYGYGNVGELLLVFKSGSFGSPEFLQKAVDNLCELQTAKLL